VDRAALAVSLAERLRAAGVAVGFSNMATFSAAQEQVPPDALRALYWTARISLIQRESDLAVFDEVFRAVFDEVHSQVDPHARRQALPSPKNDDDAYTPIPGGDDSIDDEGLGTAWTTSPRSVAGEQHDDDHGLVFPERLPNEVAGLADIPFPDFDAADLEVLSTWLNDALRDWPTRRSRREVPHHAGRRIALRPTLARARRTGFEPIDLVYVAQVPKPRRVVMLCDVSQSMESYAMAYFHLMRAAALATQAEVFAFATTLSRLTSVLAHRSPEVAIEKATAAVTDRFGGTRIASNLRTLMRSRFGDRLRGAIVLVASDGWDSEPPEAMTEAMQRLRRRAHRVIWLNPRAAAPGYEPLVGSMAAALPYCDRLLPADTLRALADVVRAIVDDS
jgi:hypothetical protein